ncbi:murein biosynthesis integral membrane protein MurJ [Corynebacterium guangdongense]|uniref:Peptidoglycan lipid II flippase n=1 Tax=Corynebacterium guangdongense TaxID=1783348 RepID=A0ABU2A1V5_9CORY|nr:murein biosynthesis integral membrane protein MurJ [Corynebacterium guangdongense]MDR7330583.1 putative peptidoglycan lipid II flippase [Corynebacterium guangdongense]
MKAGTASEAVDKRPALTEAPEPVVDRSTLTAAPGAVPPPMAEDVASGTPDAAPTATTSDAQVVRSTGSMAIATLLSRITGFIRTVLIGSTLGTAVGSAFTAANTLPNMITEIVLGSVLTALVVPVLTRAEKEDPDRGAAFIRRLFTLTFSLMTVVTVIAVIFAPQLTRIQLNAEGEVNIQLATNFAYLLLPQIFFYGMFSLFMAILNTKEIFRPGAWAPVVNNIVTIGVLLLYSTVPGSINPAAPTSLTDPHVLLIGLGTTLGVVVQCLIMVPPLLKAGVDLRPLWGIDPRLKQFTGMAAAIVVYVGVSQAGLIVTNRIASASDAAAVLIYSNAWLILQVPYGIVGVALLTAIMPRLSRNAADGDDKAVVRDLTLATKLTFIAIIPIIAFLTFFGPAIGHALFNYGAYDDTSAEITGLTISFSAFTLIPYALVMLHLRVFYAREEAWTPTLIVAGITGTKIVLSMLAPQVATSPATVVILLAAANGFGYVTGAVIGAQLLRRKLGSLGGPEIMRTTVWAAIAGVVGGVAGLLVRSLLRNFAGGFYDWMEGIDSISSAVFLMELTLVGVVFIITVGLVLARSGLPEVQTLGRSLTRIPGMSRFIKPDEDKAIDTGEADVRDMYQQMFAQDVFNSSPVPPPMSAGVVRGPRLVPGAPVSDGRFRLLVDHGSVAGARFWQALEQSTGKHVALTFIDTTGQAPMAPRPVAESARLAAEVTRNTRKLAKLGHAAIAPNIRVLGYRSGALIVSDWVEGSPLREVARTALDPEHPATLHPQAVALALAPLANAAAEAEAAGTPLGLDNSARLRVSTKGTTVLAFPGVLPNASVQQDASGIASALELLAEATADGDKPADPTLKQIAFDARAVATESASETPSEPDDPTCLSAANAKVLDLGHRLAEFGRAGTASPETRAELADADTPDDTPADAAAVSVSASELIRRGLLDPVDMGSGDTGAGEKVSTQDSGFGSRGYTRSGTVAVAGAAVVFVVLVAGATTYLTGLLSGDSATSPINADSLQGSQVETQPRQLPIVQPISDASVWQAPGQDPDADNPGTVSAAVDADPATAWRSNEYPNGLGTKPGIGLALTAQRPVQLQHLQVLSPSQGARISVYLVPEGTDPQTVTDLSTLPRIMQGTLMTGRSNIDLAARDISPDTATTSPTVTPNEATDSLPSAAGVIVWFSDLPEDDDYIELAEVALIGLNTAADAARLSEGASASTPEFTEPLPIP